MKCQKCNKNFLREELQESHDIPKYLGGIDLDGRHLLCKECHKKYDKLILINCLDFIGEILLNDEDIISWQIELKKQSESLKSEFRNIVRKIYRDFFDKNEVKKSGRHIRR